MFFSLQNATVVSPCLRLNFVLLKFNYSYYMKVK